MAQEQVSPDAADRPSKPGTPSNELPVTSNLKLVYLVSLLIALLTFIASGASIIFRDRIYPAEQLVQAFLPNDFVNLFIGLPILLGSMFLAQRGSLVGLLFWPGAIFYGLYNYLIYLLGMPFGVMYLVHMVIVTLSIYTLIGLLVSIDGAAVKERLMGNVPERLVGGVLFVAGIAFGLLAVFTIEKAEISDVNLHPAELALSSADFIISAAWIIGGVLLWRRRSIGYVFGAGLLFSLSMLFVGLLIVLLLHPLVSQRAFSLSDFVVVLIMTIVSFVPLLLFLRGVRKFQVPETRFQAAEA